MILGIHLIFRRKAGKDNEYLLHKRINTGFRDGYYALPGGHNKEGETFKQAAVREAYEELGIKLKEITPIHVIYRKRDKGVPSVETCFLVEKYEGKLKNIEAHKHEPCKWYPASHLPEPMVPHMKHIIKCIEENSPFSEFGW